MKKKKFNLRLFILIIIILFAIFVAISYLSNENIPKSPRSDKYSSDGSGLFKDLPVNDEISKKEKKFVDDLKNAVSASIGAADE